MAKLEDCPGFETFGRDVKTAREAMTMPRRVLAEMVHVDPRYLANIENVGDIPSVPVIIQLAKICKLPMARYFDEKALQLDSEQRQRTSYKLKLCPEQYLSIIEGAIDGAIKIQDKEAEGA